MFLNGMNMMLKFLHYVFVLPVKNPLCRAHLLEVGDGIMRREEWALFMFDSMNKLPSGLLEGNIVELGNVDECLLVHGDGKYGSFGGRYCLVRIPLEEEVAGQPLELETAVCVPSSCSAEDLQNLYRGSFRLNATVNPLSCRSINDSQPFTALELTAIAIIILFLVIVLIGSITDCYVGNTRFRKQWLLAFSIYKNGLRLQSTSSKGVTFPVLHGIRTLAMSLVVTANVYKYAVFSKINDNNVIFQGWLSDWSHIWLTSRGVGLEIFLVISALLTSYKFMEARTRGSLFSLKGYVLHRYLRLTPLFAVMLLVQASLLNRLGSSPRWHRESVLEERNCRSDWWKMLLYIHNWWDIKPNECLEHTWFLAVHMQLYILSPLVLLPLYWKPRVGLILLSLLLLIVHAAVYCVSYLNHVKVDLLRNFNETNVQFFRATYTRSISWLVGLALGYFLHVKKQQGHNLNSAVSAIKHAFMKRTSLLLMWMFVFILCFLPVLIVYPFIQENYHYEALESAFYLTFAKSSFCFGIAIAIALCVLGHGGAVNRILSRGYKFPFSRLCFAIYIVHITIVEIKFYNATIKEHASDFSMILNALYVLGYSILLAVFMKLLFEMPMANLQHLLFETDKGDEGYQNENDGILRYEDPPLEMVERMMQSNTEL